VDQRLLPGLGTVQQRDGLRRTERPVVSQRLAGEDLILLVVGRVLMRERESAGRRSAFGDLAQDRPGKMPVACWSLKTRRA
jgi:hypothetical protein